MILNDGTDWQPEGVDIVVWSRAYPGLDIEAELAQMEAWCHSQPKTRLKTRRGIRRFVNSWLSKSHRRLKKPGAETRRNTLQHDLTDRSWA